jgi:hypothetical protein
MDRVSGIRGQGSGQLKSENLNYRLPAPRAYRPERAKHCLQSSISPSLNLNKDEHFSKVSIYWRILLFKETSRTILAKVSEMFRHAIKNRMCPNIVIKLTPFGVHSV